jgi:hypothetical protein
VAALLANTRADEMPELEKPTAHTLQGIEGWKVRIDDRLLQPPNKELGSRAIKALAAKLADINLVVSLDERPAQFAGQELARRRFSGASHSHENKDHDGVTSAP